jgi:hypothetical protein
MIERDPEAFLSSLYHALDRRPQADPSLLPAILSFYAAKSAVSMRMNAIDGLAAKFEELVNYPNRGAELVARLPIENQVLFDFFGNALSALESFCLSSYYVGVGIDGTKFDINKKPKGIDPAEVLRRFQIFEPTEGFTVTLSGLPGFVGNDRAQGHEKYAAPQACARALPYGRLLPVPRVKLTWISGAKASGAAHGEERYARSRRSSFARVQCAHQTTGLDRWTA